MGVCVCKLVFMFHIYLEEVNTTNKTKQDKSTQTS